MSRSNISEKEIRTPIVCLCIPDYTCNPLVGGEQKVLLPWSPVAEAQVEKNVVQTVSMHDSRSH